MKIYITRHSKTVWNEERKLQGRKDSLLTKEGYDNACALKEYIQDQHYDYIYCSPIKRAVDTAEVIFNEDVIIDERIIEMNFGIFEGIYIPDLLKREDQLYYNMWHHPELFDRIEEGESYQEVMNRAQSFISHLKTLEDDAQVFIVTHGMFFIVLLACMFNYKQAELTKLNQNVAEGCSLTCITYKDNQFILDYYNKNDFLPHHSNQSFAK